MEIVHNICYLTIGDKIKHVGSGEGGDLIKVISPNLAIVEFFDETIEVKASDIAPLKLLSYQQYNSIQFYTELKQKSKKIKSKKKVVANEIDLHAEVLFPSHYRTMSNENIIQQQMSSLHNFIEQIIRSHHREAIIIHGKGSGSLRSQVIDALESRYDIFNHDISDVAITKFKL